MRDSQYTEGSPATLTDVQIDHEIRIFYTHSLPSAD